MGVLVVRHHMSWIRGRQDTGYLKWPIYSFRIGSFGADAFILKFALGCDVPRHQDPVDGSDHYRLNIVLKHAGVGGEFLCENPILDYSRLKLFRPDQNPHSVTRIEAGTRYVMSLGLALEKRKPA